MPAELKLVASQSTAPLARVAAVRRAAHVRPESALSRTRTTRAFEGSRKKTRTFAPWLQTATLQAVAAVSRRVHGEKSLAGPGLAVRCTQRAPSAEVMRTRTRAPSAGDVAAWWKASSAPV